MWRHNVIVFTIFITSYLHNQIWHIHNNNTCIKTVPVIQLVRWVFTSWPKLCIFFTVVYCVFVQEDNIGLHWAVFSGSTDIAGLFLNACCDMEAANEHGDRPLYVQVLFLINKLVYNIPQAINYSHTIFGFCKLGL